MDTTSAFFRDDAAFRDVNTSSIYRHLIGESEFFKSLEEAEEEAEEAEEAEEEAELAQRVLQPWEETSEVVEGH
jgi:hypothetical protein